MSKAQATFLVRVSFFHVLTPFKNALIEMPVDHHIQNYINMNKQCSYKRTILKKVLLMEE